MSGGNASGQGYLASDPEFWGLYPSLKAKYHPAAVYTILFLLLGLRVYCACWIPFFRNPVIATSAFKVLFLQFVFVIQAVTMGAFVNDMIFQHARERITFPRVPILFVLFIGFFCEIVFSVSHAFRPTMEHAIFSHFIPFLLSVLLHLSYMRSEPFSRGWEVLTLYIASVTAVFWNDIREMVLWSEEGCARQLREIPVPLVVADDMPPVLVGGGGDSTIAFVKPVELFVDVATSSSEHCFHPTASSSTQTEDWGYPERKTFYASDSASRRRPKILERETKLQTVHLPNENCIPEQSSFWDLFQHLFLSREDPIWRATATQMVGSGNDESAFASEMEESEAKRPPPAKRYQTRARAKSKPSTKRKGETKSKARAKSKRKRRT